jgi:hypothetical protein
MVSVNRFFLEKLGAADATQFVGNDGEMWYDPDTGVLRISDGATPGGIILGALGSTGYCGSFFDSTIQTNLVSVNKFKYNTTDISDGVLIESNSHIKVLHTGNYNIQFSAQIDKTDSGEDDVDIWLMKNNVNISNSSTRMHVIGNNTKDIAAWNWIVSASANDYFEIAWYSPDPNLRIYAEGVQTNPTRPGIPSVILTVSQV